MKMDEPIRVEYTPLHEDLWVTQRYASRHFVPRVRKYGFWILLAVVVTGFISLFDLLYSDAVQVLLSKYVGRLPAMAAPFGLLMVIWWLGWKPFIRWAQGYFAKGLEERAPLAPLSFTAGDERLEWKSPYSASWLGYEAIERLFLTPTTFGLIYSGTVISVPLRAFDERCPPGTIIKFILNRLHQEAREASLQDRRIRALV